MVWAEGFPPISDRRLIPMGCFYCDAHHEGREAIMFKVGEMKAGVLYLFKDQAHKGPLRPGAEEPQEGTLRVRSPRSWRISPRIWPGPPAPSRSCGAAPRSTWAPLETPTPISTSTLSPKYEGGVRVRRCLCHHQPGAGASLRRGIPGDDCRPAGESWACNCIKKPGRNDSSPAF